MNYSRIALAALGATVAYFVLGGILFGALPSLREEFLKYPAVYRTQDDMKRVMPMGMISILVAICALLLQQTHLKGDSKVPPTDQVPVDDHVWL